MNRSQLMPLTLIVLLAAVTEAAAQDADPASVRPPDPIFRTGAPSIGEVIEENTFYFKQMAYDPPVVAPTVDPATADLSTPEGTAIAQISAMVRADFAWFRSLWTEASQQLMEARDQERGQTPEFWRDAWRKGLAGKRFELTQRVDTGPYVLIEYRAVDPDAGDDEEPLLFTAALESVEGRWLLTQRLASDPVLLFWRQPGHRLKRMARGIHVD